MKYYSEKTKKLYDTEEELKAAEAQRYRDISKSERAQKVTEAVEELQRVHEEKLKKQEEGKRRDEVTKAYDEAYDAFKRAQELADKYASDYGRFVYHKTTEGGENIYPSWVWRWLMF